MAYTTNWTVTTYASADNLQQGQWYSARSKKLDGLSLGTVISIFKDKNGDWGTLDGSLDSRYPGWIECDGRSVNAVDYPDLFEIIGNTYGGNATKTVTNRTKVYSGSFNLPNYHNRLIMGIGNVDGNKSSSQAVVTYQGPDPNSIISGDSNVVGSSGGNWYIDTVDAQGDPPDEQVYSGTGSSDSKFFKLGSLTTTGQKEITGEVTYTITGNISATIGPLSGVPTTPPQHEHDVITAQADAIAVGYVAWGTPAFYQIGNGEIGSTLYSSIGYNSVVSPGGEVNRTFNNYWAGDVANPSGLPGGGNASAAIGVNNVQGNVTVYSPGTLRTHTHYLKTASDFGSPQNVYGYGNEDGGGIAAGGMAQNNTTTIQFTQTQLALTSNEAAVEMNVSKVVIPTPALTPENTIPVLNKYHRVKYIIKAY
jgi:hypothetical protein